MARPDGQRCDRCRYFYDHVERPAGYPPEPGTAGRCRRFPPVALRQFDEEDDSFASNAAYPAAYRTHWCGEYAPANPETVTEGAATLARMILLGDLTAARALADKLKEG